MEIIVGNHAVDINIIRPVNLKNNTIRQKRHIFVIICVFFVQFLAIPI